MGYRDLLAGMHAAMRDARPLAAVADELGVSAQRLGIYRRMVRGHVDSALRARVEVAYGVLGGEDDTPRWRALFAAYLAAHPPTHWALGEAANAFPEFLAGCRDRGEHGVTDLHLCLAELECTLHAVNRDLTRLPDPAGLDAPVLNPTLQIVQYPYLVVPFVTAWWRGERPPEPEPGDAEMVLLFRRPASGYPCMFRGTDALLFALKMAHDQLSVDEAAAQSGQPAAAVQAVLGEAIRIGLVIAPS